MAVNNVYKDIMGKEERETAREMMLGRFGSSGVHVGLAILLHMWYAKEFKRVGLEDDVYIDFEDMPHEYHKAMKRMARRILELLVEGG